MNPERINIKDLTVEEPEKKIESSVVFNPERDITDKEWDTMKSEFFKEMEDAGSSRERVDCLGRAAELKMLFPERVDELNLDKEIWDRWDKAEDEPMHSLHTPDTLVNMKILFPEKFQEIDLDDGYYKIKWDDMKVKLEKYQKEVVDEYAFANNFSDLARKMKIICPEKASELNLDEETAQKMIIHINDERSGNRWYNLLLNAANFKILFPERAGELKLDDDFWQKAKKLYKTDCQGIEPAYFAACLKILAADRVDITKEGIEFTMQGERESLESGSSSIPEIRNF